MSSPDSQSSASIALVHRAQAGDLEALNSLFGRYYERVRRIVRLRLGDGLRGSLESGDILQETFIAALRAFDRFELRDEASLINWLAKISERQIKGAAKKAQALKRDKAREVALRHVSDSVASGVLKFEPVAPIELPDGDAARHEEAEILEQCLAELKEEYREVILLRDYAGASWDLATRLLGSPSADAARMLYSRALVELTKLVRRRRSNQK